VRDYAFELVPFGAAGHELVRIARRARRFQHMWHQQRLELGVDVAGVVHQRPGRRTIPGERQGEHVVARARELRHEAVILVSKIVSHDRGSEPAVHHQHHVRLAGGRGRERRGERLLAHEEPHRLPACRRHSRNVRDETVGRDDAVLVRHGAGLVGCHVIDTLQDERRSRARSRFLHDPRAARETRTSSVFHERPASGFDRYGSYNRLVQYVPNVAVRSWMHTRPATMFSRARTDRALGGSLTLKPSCGVVKGRPYLIVSPLLTTGLPLLTLVASYPLEQTP
jgi:hypothetical protein